jgi:hypothetical protein
MATPEQSAKNLYHLFSLEENTSGIISEVDM